MIEKDVFKLSVEQVLKADYGKGLSEAQEHEKYMAISKTLMALLADRWGATTQAYQGTKQASYLSAEFLMGRALGNNLINLGLYDSVKEVLEELDINLNVIEETEEDAGLGNGGLGRLAACFMDSCATLDLPVTGYGIRYKFGIFKQKFSDGFQVEEADNWTKYGDPWSVRRDEDTVTVQFDDGDVKAVPYDTPIIGYGTENINTLRLWQAEPMIDFEFQLFNDQAYDASVEKKNRAEDISRVLYPNDSKEEGKILRLKQQYFFVSASLQDLMRSFKATHGTHFEKFPEYHAVQLNDTHPAVAVPELMRLLVKEEGVLWDQAWEITQKTLAYTNHTILAEALEQWPVELYKKISPVIVEFVEEIDDRFVKELEMKGYEDAQIESMRIIENDMIKMAWLSIHGTHATNGVAALHTEILKEQELNDWYELYPERFQNKTNGITQRRWLALCNKELSAYITELLGSDDWVTDLDQLKALEKFADDDSVMAKFLEIKHTKKVQLANYIQEVEGIEIDPNSIYDIQIKRLHEYKRQLLNAFHILDLYHRLKANPEMDVVPRTFIFGAKAAPGYERAKAIIKFIHDIAEIVNNDTEINAKMKVVFVENYRVSYAEKLFPAADVSEQISTAGKEASGTGNMKFMLNGAPTLGTYDGANVEIVEEAGFENNFIFGARVEDIQEMWNSYDPKEYYLKTPGLKRVVDALIDCTFDADESDKYFDLYQSILRGAHWHRSDNYFILKDFDAYREAHKEVDEAYRDRLGWAQKCWMNIAGAGKFSSDRTINEYAKDIWFIKPEKI